MGQAEQLNEAASALRATSATYSQTDGELTGITAVLSGSMQSLLANWQGSSQQAFVQACNRAWGDQQALSGSLGSASTALSSLAGVLETNAVAIGNLEKIDQSDAIKPLQLQAAQGAADTAWSAIAAAVAAQAEAVNSAAGQVGVCSTGEGGPWGDAGLNDGASAFKLKSSLKGLSDWYNGLSGKQKFLWQLFIVALSNSSSGLVSLIAPNSAGSVPPLVVSALLGGITSGGILSAIELLGVEGSGATAIIQSLLGGLAIGSTTAVVFHEVFPVGELPAGVVSDKAGQLSNGDKIEVISYKDGTVVKKVTLGNGEVDETTLSPSGQLTQKTIPAPTPTATTSPTPSPTPQPTNPLPTGSLGNPFGGFGTPTPDPQPSPSPQPTTGPR